MIDREKVLKGLKCCRMNGKGCRQCPYNKDCDEMPDFGNAYLCSDALELLNEQQETIVSLQSTINKLTKALAEKPEQKIFVDSDGKMTPLPVHKHGHWMTVEENYDDEQHWQCSACGCEWYLEAGNPEENNMLYCPECGAKMDGEAKQDG